MRRILIAIMLLAMLAAVTGCGDGGGHGGPPPVIVKDILSDETVDGDIRKDLNGFLTVSQVRRDSLTSVLAGIDPITLNEFRAFLDFPLTVIPLNAAIESATLDIVVDNLTPLSASVPLRIELVSFDPPLVPTDFNRSDLIPLAATTIDPPVTSLDLNRHVVVDVTRLMVTAQSLALPSFQVRIMTDLGVVTTGLVEINDSVSDTAPLLTVAYF